MSPTPARTASPEPSATLRPSPTACAETQGSVLQRKLPSEYLPDGLQFRIYLPPCYNTDTSRSYPSLYLIHGQTFNDDQWERIGAPAAADRLIATDAVPPFIIVMPYDRSSAQPWQDQFDEAVVEELIPYVDSIFRACPERDCRAVGGLSRGGGWAIHFGLTHPDLFSAVGGHSPAVFDSEGPRLKRMLDTIPPGQMPRWFLDVGEDDRLAASALSFEQSLAERGIPHDWRLYTGVHNEEYWSKHVEEYLRWYGLGWGQ
jgi:enterochelin esterase-like enzyme